MMNTIFGKAKRTSESADVKKTVIASADDLSDTDRRLRDQFYFDPEEENSEIGRMISPKIHAPQLYKQLANFGHEKGWIGDPEKYPLMYPLLFNASDTAQGVYWRFQQRVKNDDSNHTGALKMTLGWCVYVAMADAYYCHENWNDLRKAGMIYKLENTCGFDNVDDFVKEKFNIMNEDELRNHILELCEIAKKPWEEAESTKKISQARESMTAMFYYGIELGMQYLGLLDKSTKMV